MNVEEGLSVEKTRIEWRCRHCGMTFVLAKSGGKPGGGACNRRGRDCSGLMKPHVWEKIRERA